VGSSPAAMVISSKGSPDRDSETEISDTSWPARLLVAADMGLPHRDRHCGTSTSSAAPTEYLHELAVFPNGKHGLPRPIAIKWGLIFSFTTKLDYDCETKPPTDDAFCL
jgi:hypothetical protein